MKTIGIKTFFAAVLVLAGLSNSWANCSSHDHNCFLGATPFDPTIGPYVPATGPFSFTTDWIGTTDLNQTLTLPDFTEIDELSTNLTSNNGEAMIEHTESAISREITDILNATRGYYDFQINNVGSVAATYTTEIDAGGQGFFQTTQGHSVSSFVTTRRLTGSLGAGAMSALTMIELNRGGGGGSSGSATFAAFGTQLLPSNGVSNLHGVNADGSFMTAINRSFASTAPSYTRPKTISAPRYTQAPAPRITPPRPAPSTLGAISAVFRNQQVLAPAPLVKTAPSYASLGQIGSIGPIRKTQSSNTQFKPLGATTSLAALSSFQGSTFQQKAAPSSYGSFGAGGIKAAITSQLSFPGQNKVLQASAKSQQRVYGTDFQTTSLGTTGSTNSLAAMAFSSSGRSVKDAIAGGLINGVVLGGAQYASLGTITSKPSPAPVSFAAQDITNIIATNLNKDPGARNKLGTLLAPLAAKNAAQIQEFNQFFSDQISTPTTQDLSGERINQLVNKGAAALGLGAPPAWIATGLTVGAPSGLQRGFYNIDDLEKAIQSASADGSATYQQRKLASDYVHAAIATGEAIEAANAGFGPVINAIIQVAATACCGPVGAAVASAFTTAAAGGDLGDVVKSAAIAAASAFVTGSKFASGSDALVNAGKVFAAQTAITYVDTGDLKQSLIAGATAGAFKYVGGKFPTNDGTASSIFQTDGGFNISAATKSVLAHGAIGCASYAAQGDSCSKGFKAQALSKAVNLGAAQVNRTYFEGTPGKFNVGEAAVTIGAGCAVGGEQGCLNAGVAYVTNYLNDSQKAQQKECKTQKCKDYWDEVDEKQNAEALAAFTDELGDIAENFSIEEAAEQIQATIERYSDAIEANGLTGFASEVLQDARDTAENLAATLVAANEAHNDADSEALGRAAAGGTVVVGAAVATKGGQLKALPPPKPKGNANTAPENGTIFVDSRGNAIVTPPGGKITGSPDGRFIQARDASGNPTGVRIDGPHSPRTHNDPRALNPHGHVPGVNNPDGTPWLPID